MAFGLWLAVGASVAADQSAGLGSPGGPVKGMWVLDRAHPLVSVLLAESSAQLRQAKFVEVDVAEVLNSNRYALSFEVSFRSGTGVQSALGNFSLYPADRPGQFIVPTQRRLRTGGSIEVLMKVLDAPGAENRGPVSVRIRTIRLVEVAGESGRSRQ
jgi:hypothetical protein